MTTTQTTTGIDFADVKVGDTITFRLRAQERGETFFFDRTGVVTRKTAKTVATATNVLKLAAWYGHNVRINN